MYNRILRSSALVCWFLEYYNLQQHSVSQDNLFAKSELSNLTNLRDERSQKGGNDIQQVPVHFFNVKEVNNQQSENSASGMNGNSEFQIKVIKEIPFSRVGDDSNKQTESPSETIINENAKETNNKISLTEAKQTEEAHEQLESTEVLKSENSNTSVESVSSENSKNESGKNGSVNGNKSSGLRVSNTSNVSSDSTQASVLSGSSGSSGSSESSASNKSSASNVSNASNASSASNSSTASQAASKSQNSPVSESSASSNSIPLASSPLNATMLPPTPFVRPKDFFHKINYGFGSRFKWNKFFEQFKQFQAEFALLSTFSPP